MEYILFPTLEYVEVFIIFFLTFKDFNDFAEKREREMQNMDFNESDGFNLIQKQAIYSILTKAHNPYPFLLFGPPGMNLKPT